MTYIEYFKNEYVRPYCDRVFQRLLGDTEKAKIEGQTRAMTNGRPRDFSCVSVRIKIDNERLYIKNQLPLIVYV